MTVVLRFCGRRRFAPLSRNTTELVSIPCTGNDTSNDGPLIDELYKPRHETDKS